MIDDRPCFQQLQRLAGILKARSKWVSQAFPAGVYDASVARNDDLSVTEQLQTKGKP
jgi:hypothetical protein